MLWKLVTGLKYWRIWMKTNSDNNINEKWANIKAIIKETKQQLIEKDESTGTFKNRRFDKESKIAIEEMEKAREK